MTVETTQKSTKGVTIVTYILALAFLIAGLCVPLYGGQGSNQMLVMYLPDAVNKAFGSQLFKGDWVKLFAETEIGLFGANVNIFAWTLVIYALATVVGLFMLIPVCLGKKEKKTSATCAFAVETVAAVVLGVYFVFYMNFVLLGWYNYNVLIAFGGVLLMLIVQSVANKKGLGVAKLFLFLLSALTLLMLYNIFALIPNVDKGVADMAANMKLPNEFSGKHAVGFEGFLYFLDLNNVATVLKAFSLYEQILYCVLLITATVIVFNFIIDIIGLVTGAKYASDGTLATGKGSKLFGLIRYAVQFCGVVAIILMLLILKEKLGLYLYLVLLLSLILLIVAIVRLARVRSIRKKNKAAAGVHFDDEVMTGEYSENVEVVSTPAPQTVIYEQREEQPSAETKSEEKVAAAPAAPAEQPAPEPVAARPAEEMTEIPAQPAPTASYYPEYSQTKASAETESEPENEQLSLPAEELPESKVIEQTHTIVYNVKTIYNGPTDEFMDTLTDAEKIEFAKVFIEKSKGSFANVPDYVIGGDNSGFFPMIFVYLSKFRAVLSRELMAKIYKYISK